jgi:hypothetical protein
MEQSRDRTHDNAQTEPSGDAGREGKDRAQQDASGADQRRESGEPGGGEGRADVVDSGRYGVDPNAPESIQNAYGQGARGAAGYQDSGGSELTMRDGQLLGGLTAGPNGEPTIDIHGKDRPPKQPPAAPR